MPLIYIYHCKHDCLVTYINWWCRNVCFDLLNPLYIYTSNKVSCASRQHQLYTLEVAMSLVQNYFRRKKKRNFPSPYYCNTQSSVSRCTSVVTRKFSSPKKLCGISSGGEYLTCQCGHQGKEDGDHALDLRSWLHLPRARSADVLPQPSGIRSMSFILEPTGTHREENMCV